MNETLVKYLAGLMDADGSLSFSFKKYDHADDIYHLGMTLCLASSDAVDLNGFIDGLPDRTGYGGVYRYGISGQYKSWKINKRSHLEMFLPRLIKHMVIKGRHWNLLLEKWREQRGVQLSLQEREDLTASSRASRIKNTGPIKPKNHPTWAWLAGYLDGDGWYRMKYQEHPHNYWQISVGAVAHDNDIHVLQFLQKAFGGAIRNQGQSPNVSVWKRNLGINDASFAFDFLPKIRKHAQLKRYKIDQILECHQQRLSAPSVDKKNYCKIDGCGRPATGHLMCGMHYQRWRRHGDPRYVRVSNSLAAPLCG